MRKDPKPLKWVGTSREDMRAFPKAVKAELGSELMAVQYGVEPSDFKPMPGIGAGAFELRLRLDGAWRVIYVAKWSDAVHVLHAFKKTTQKTSKADIELAKARYNAIRGGR